MPALPPYIPNKDSLLAAWLANFTALTSATPALYGLSPSDAATIALDVATWSNAYLPVTSPSTKTAQAVGVKNTAKVTVLGQIRPYAQQISLNAGVSSGDKIALGLNPRTSTPQPVTPPNSSPVLTLQSASNLSAVLRYRDAAASPSVKGKPYGVNRLEIFGMVSATPITAPVPAPLLAAPTKSPFLLDLHGFTPGVILYLWGRWVTRTGGTSPWSPIISFNVLAAS